jgi:hypothetical protein
MKVLSRTEKLVLYARLGALPSVLLCLIVWADLALPGSEVHTAPILHKVADASDSSSGYIIIHPEKYWIAEIRGNVFERATIGDTASLEISNILRLARKVTLFREGHPAASTFAISLLEDGFWITFFLIPAFVFQHPDKWYHNRRLIAAYFIFVALNLFLWLYYFVF